MKTIIKESNKLTVLALLLALPTAYFICIAVLKYELDINGPFDAIAPFLERVGIKDTLGWNINLLILFGPIIAALLTIFQLLKVEQELTKDQFLFQFAIKKSWLPLLVAAFSLSLLAILFIYLLGENCRCF